MATNTKLKTLISLLLAGLFQPVLPTLLWSFDRMAEVRANTRYGDGLFYLGDQYYSKQNWEWAIRYYRLGLLHEPQNTRMRYKLAVAYGQIGSLKPAIKELVEVVRQDPYFNDAKRRLKKYKHLDHYISEDYDVTVNFMDLKEPVAKIAPGHLEKFAQLPARQSTREVIEIADGEGEKVLRGSDIDNTIAKAPEDALSIDLQGPVRIIKDSSGAPADARMPVNIEREKNPVEKIQDIIDEGRFKTALAEVEKLPLDYKKMAEANWLRGQIFHRQGKQDLAIKEFTAALKVRPDDKEYLFLLAKSYLRNGDFEKSQNTYQKILKLDPANLFAALDSAQAYFEIGNNKKAREGFTKLEKENPNLSEVQLALAQLDLREGKNEESKKRAIYILERLEPNNALAMNILGEIYLASEEPEKALIQFEKSVKNFDTFTLAIYNRGKTYLRLNKFDEAIADFTRVFKLDSSNVENGYQLVNTLINQGKVDEGRLFFSQLAGQTPNHHRVQALEGFIQKFDRNLPLAIRSFESARRQNPNIPEYWVEIADSYLQLKDYDTVITLMTQGTKRFGGGSAAMESLLNSAKQGQKQQQLEQTAHQNLLKPGTSTTPTSGSGGGGISLY